MPWGSASSKLSLAPQLHIWSKMTGVGAQMLQIACEIQGAGYKILQHLRMRGPMKSSSNPPISSPPSSELPCGISTVQKFPPRVNHRDWFDCITGMCSSDKSNPENSLMDLAVWYKALYFFCQSNCCRWKKMIALLCPPILTAWWFQSMVCLIFNHT